MVSLSSFLPSSWLGWGKSNEEMRQVRREELQKRRQQRANLDVSLRAKVLPGPNKEKSNEEKDTAKMMRRMSKSASSSFRKGVFKMW
jgi:hypothetical protein